MIQQKPELILVALFLFGMVAGLLLAAWIIYLYWQIGKGIERLRRAIQKQRALRALEEAAIEIDDDKMICAACWQERHPGERWYLGRRTLCIQHLLEEGEPATATESTEDQTYALQH